MHHKSPTGFSLLELIVVIAGLGILSSLAIPNYMKYLDYAKIDEAKSLLNSVAADCLQGLRRKGEGRMNETVNGDIISFTRLKNTGYVFKNGANRSTDKDYLPNCSTVLITAALEDDRAGRFPDLGFTMAVDGTLSKIAVNSGSETSFPAESWAGNNTTDETALIEWQKLNAAIIKAKGNCEKTLVSLIKNPGTGKFSTWDPVKTSKCTTKPPKFEDKDTCTTNGCTTDVYYLDGEICGYSQAAFDKCRSEKTTAACQEEKDKKSSTAWTTQTISGDQLPNCDEPLWFYEGRDVGSAEAWKPLMCEKNKKELLSTIHSGPVEHCDISPIYICGGEEILKNGSREDAKAKFDTCLDNSNDNKCTSFLNADAIKRSSGGAYTSPTPSDMSPPIGEDCNIRYWYCKESGKIYKGTGAEQSFNNDPKCQKNCSAVEMGLDDWCELTDDWAVNHAWCKEYQDCLNGR